MIRAEIQEDGTLAFQDAIERAPLRHELYTLDQRTAESAELRALWAEIEACGGAAKQCMSGLFLVHLPEACLLDVGTRLRNIWQHEQDGDEE